MAEEDTWGHAESEHRRPQSTPQPQSRLQASPGRRGLVWGPAIAVIVAILIAAAIAVWAGRSDAADDPGADTQCCASATGFPAPGFRTAAEPVRQIPGSFRLAACSGKAS